MQWSFFVSEIQYCLTKTVKYKIYKHCLHHNIDCWGIYYPTKSDIYVLVSYIGLYGNTYKNYNVYNNR